MKIFRIRTLVLFAFCILGLTYSNFCYAKKISKTLPAKKKVLLAPAKRTVTSLVKPVAAPVVAKVSEPDKALEVRGQSRNLSMMLVLKNRKENIDFVHPREHYQSEIKQTIY